MCVLFKVLCLFIIIYLPNNCYSHYFEWRYGDNALLKKLSPEELMVDVTNDLSYKILYFHSISNRNNFAFSPTTLASVLIALYEGTDGRATNEIYQVLKLPWNRDKVRIGYRDIHRRLRTYFFNQENPLNGLSLNLENVTITPEYETILKFYGYDLRIDTTSLKPIAMPPTTVNSSTIDTSISTTEKPQSKITPELPSTTMKPVEDYTEPITTTISNIEELVTTFRSETTYDPITPIINTSSLSTVIPITTEFPSTTEEPITTTTNIITDPTPDIPKPTAFKALKPILLQTGDKNDTTSLMSVTFPTLRLIDDNDKIFSSRHSAKISNSNTRQLANHEMRSKRHYPFGLYNTNLFTFAVEPYPNPDTQFVDVDPQPFEPREISLNSEINHIFYLNPYETIQTTFKVYNTVLNFKYVESIRSSIIELELDSKDFSLILMVPDFDFQLENLITSLKIAPTLKVIRREMTPRWVKAIIPDFNLHGNIFLTNDLQNMGILEVFEPNKADFRPMTEDNIYVKHIEQPINVRIRTHPIDQLKRNIAPYYKPIDISANHPFLFFIIDKELDVATMAGRIINPLNIRIQ